MNLRDIRSQVDRLKGTRDRVRQDLDAANARTVQNEKALVVAEQARAIIQEVAQATQKELEYHVGEIVSLALAAVFENPYALRLDFVQRRNKTECDILFARGGETFRPVDATGGGAVDVTSLALRFSVWSLRQQRYRNTIILDEPFRFLSRDLQGRAAAMLGEISRKLGLQIIMVSHSPDLIEGADRVFEMSIRKGVSHVTCQDAEKDAAATSCHGARSERSQEDTRRDNGQRPRREQADRPARPRGSK